MNISPEFLKLAKQYCKKNGMENASQKDLEGIAMWLATTDENVVDEVLDDKDDEDRAREAKGIQVESIDNVAINEAGELKTISKKKKGGMEFTIKASAPVTVVTSVHLEQQEEKKQQPIVLEERPKKSKALQRLNFETQKFKSGELELERKENPRDISVDSTRSYQYYQSFLKKAAEKQKKEKLLNSLMDDEYYTLSNHVNIEDLENVDYDIIEKQIEEFRKEQRRYSNRKSRFFADEERVYGKHEDMYELRIAADGKIISSRKVHEYARDLPEDFKFKTYSELKKEKAMMRLAGVKGINKNAVDNIKQEFLETKEELTKKMRQQESSLMAELNRKKTEYAKGLKTKFQKNTLTLPIKKTRKSVSKKYIAPTSNMEIRGIENLFNPKYQAYAVIEKKTESGKKIRIPTYDKIVRIKKMKIKIPKGMFFYGLVDTYYPSVMAATFFQMLVSNTPLDEDYDYVYEYEVPKRKRVKYFDTEIYTDYKTGKTTKSRIVRPIEELEDKYLNSAETRTVKKHIHHKADKEAVRDSWVLHFMGVDFYSSDSAIKNCFEKKSDFESINKLAAYIYSKVKDIKNTNTAFTYENTNPRWEMLEYGYYKNEESKIRIGTPYGYKHGVKGHHSIQAPYGFVRLTEAWWENMKESHRRFDFLANFVKRNSLDVSKIKQNTVEKLRKYDQMLNTNELDWGNFVQAGI